MKHHLSICLKQQYSTKLTLSNGQSIYCFIESIKDNIVIAKNKDYDQIAIELKSIVSVAY